MTETEDNAKSKLTLSGKLTLKLGDKAQNKTGDDKKVIQVEVRKKE